MSALTNYFTSLANKMRSKTGKSTTLTPSDMITEVDAVYQAGVESVPAPVTQTKTAPAIPNGISYTNGATITPDSGKLLSSVTIPKPFGGDVANSLVKIQTLTSTSSVGNFVFPETGIYIFACASSYGNMPIAKLGNGCYPLFTKNLKHTATSGGKETSNTRFYVIKVSSLTNAYISISSAGAGTSEYIMCKIAEV